jgi:hypothetical protein
MQCFLDTLSAKGIRGSEFTREQVGANQGQAGAHATEWRRAVAGVADQRDAPRGPRGHAHLEEGVEVEVVGLLRGGQQRVALPPRAGESVNEKLALLVDVVSVVVDRF